MLDISLISNQPSVKPAEDVFEGENRIYDIVVSGFGTLDTALYNLWVIYELPSGAVMVSDKVNIGAGNDDKIVTMRDGVLTGEGIIKIQAVISTGENIFDLVEQYASGDCEYPIYKSKVYEFYINDSIDIIEEILPSDSGISQDARDYLEHVVDQIIAEGLSFDDELSSSSINAVQNKVVNEALNGKVNTSDISNSISPDASSTTKVPSVKAIKDYTDKALLRKANLKILPFYQENGVLSQIPQQSLYLFDSSGSQVITSYYISQPESVSNDFLTAAENGLLRHFRINENNVYVFTVREISNGYVYMANCVPYSYAGESGYKKLNDDYPLYLMTVNKNTGTVGLFSSISGNISWVVEGYGGTVVMEEDVSNSITTDASSTTKVPSVKAMKDYVDSGDKTVELYNSTVDLDLAVLSLFCDSNENEIDMYQDLSAGTVTSAFINAALNCQNIKLNEYSLSLINEYDYEHPSVLVGYSLAYNAVKFDSLHYKKIDDTKPIIVFYVSLSSLHAQVFSSLESIGESDNVKVIFSGIPVIKEEFRDVAFTGDYTDLKNKPSQITVDQSVTSGSQNAVAGGAVYTELMTNYYTKSETDAAIAAAIGAAIGGSY